MATVPPPAPRATRLPRLKVSIGLRLFVAVLLCFVLVGAVALQLLRWTGFDNFADTPARPQPPGLASLAAALAAEHQRYHGWAFLPADAAQRQAWLQAQWQSVQTAQRAQAAAPTDSASAPPSATLAQRLHLSDAQHRPLAGASANRLLVALASIDRIERPLQADGRTIGYLTLAQPAQPDDELAVAFLLLQQHRLGAIALAALLAGGIAALLLALHFRRPIRQLLAGAQQLEAGHFGTRLPATRSDELGQLALAFNRLAARLDDAEQARQQWIADTSHELRTPLAVLRAQLEALQDGVRSATPEHVALMRDQVLGLSRLVDDLQQLAQSAQGTLHYEMAPTAVWPLLQQISAALADAARAAGLSLELGAAPAQSTVQGDALRLRQLLGNLLQNSLRYTAAGGRVIITAQVVGPLLQIDIADSPPGVSLADRTRLGERFFRVETSRSRATGGAGLGLALSRQLVEAHGGELRFADSALGGLRVSVVLPLLLEI